MPLAVTRVRRPRSLDELTDADRLALPVVAKVLWGEVWSLEEIWAMDDFGLSVEIWEFEDEGVVRYAMWDSSGGCDAALIDCSGPLAAGAGIIQHGLQSWSMDPAEFAAVEAAWDRRGETVPSDQLR